MNFIRLLVFICFPIFRFKGFPLPLAILYALYAIPFKKVNFFRSYFYPLLFSSIYLFIVIILNNIIVLHNEGIEIKTLYYFIFPLIYLVLITIFINMKNLDKVIEVYFMVNICILLITRLFNYYPDTLVFYYRNYIFGNITTAGHYLTLIENRQLGLLGHPAWSALMIYLLGKFLAIKKDKYFYVFLSIIGIILTGGRAALFSLIILEFYTIVSKQKFNIVNKLKYVIISMILIFTVVGLTYYFNEGFRYFVQVTIEDIMMNSNFRSYSIKYRLEMYKLLFSQNLLVILFGSGSIFSRLSTNLKFFDSELVMRTFQFGIIGYLLLFLPIIISYFNSKKANNKVGNEISLFMLLFSILASLTTTVASNMIFIIFISIIIAIVEQDNKNLTLT